MKKFGIPASLPVTTILQWQTETGRTPTGIPSWNWNNCWYNSDFQCYDRWLRIQHYDRWLRIHQGSISERE